MADNCKMSPTKDKATMENSDDEGSIRTVKANTIDELHSLQRKKVITPDKSQDDLNTVSGEERHKQQLESIRYVLCVTNFYIYVCSS